MAGATQLIVAVGAVLIIVYCLILVTRRTLSFAVVMSGALLTSVLFAAVPPQESMDVYAYGYFGRLVATFHQNPYTIPLYESSQDPYLLLAHAKQTLQSPYGPGWTGLSAAVVSVTGTRTGLAVQIFRIIAIGSFFGTVLVLRTLLAHHPHANNALILYAWNPLVLFEVANNGHNDIVLVFLLLLALRAYQRRRYFWVAPALAAAFLIKFVAILVVPLVLIALLRDRTLQKRDWRLLVTGSAASIAVTVVTFLPFWRGVGTFNYLIFLAQYIGLPLLHPLTLGISILRFAGVSKPMVPIVLLFVGRALFGVIALWTAHRLWKNGSHWLPASFGVLFAGFLGFGLTYFEPWYLLWLLPFIFFWPRRMWEPAAFVITVFGLAGTILVS